MRSEAGEVPPGVSAYALLQRFLGAGAEKYHSRTGHRPGLQRGGDGNQRGHAAEVVVGAGDRWPPADVDHDRDVDRA